MRLSVEDRMRFAGGGELSGEEHAPAQERKQTPEQEQEERAQMHNLEVGLALSFRFGEVEQAAKFKKTLSRLSPNDWQPELSLPEKDQAYTAQARRRTAGEALLKASWADSTQAQSYIPRERAKIEAARIEAAKAGRRPTEMLALEKNLQEKVAVYGIKEEERLSRIANAIIRRVAGGTNVGELPHGSFTELQSVFKEAEKKSLPDKISLADMEALGIMLGEQTIRMVFSKGLGKKFRSMEGASCYALPLVKDPEQMIFLVLRPGEINGRNLDDAMLFKCKQEDLDNNLIHLTNAPSYLKQGFK